MLNLYTVLVYSTVCLIVCRPSNWLDEKTLTNWFILSLTIILFVFLQGIYKSWHSRLRWYLLCCSWQVPWGQEICLYICIVIPFITGQCIQPCNILEGKWFDEPLVSSLDAAPPGGDNFRKYEVSFDNYV